MSNLQADSSKPSQHDLWARTTTLLSALTPIFVLIVGYVLNAKVNEANLRIAQQKGAFEELKARADELKTKAEELKIKVDADSISTKSQIDKVDAVLKLLQDLTGPNNERRRVAMEAVKIVLPPKEAISILTALNNSAEPGSKQASEVRSVLAAERARLVDAMFSYEPATRQSSLRTLQQAWSNDDTIIQQLVVRARAASEERRKSGFLANSAIDSADYQRRASVYNTSAFLAVASTSNQDLRKQILEFAELAERNSPDTAVQCGRIRARNQ